MSSMKSPRRFIDIGLNLTDDMFRGRYHGRRMHADDYDAVLSRAWDIGMTKIIITSGQLSDVNEALQLAASDDRLYTTVGVHPTRCLEFQRGAPPGEEENYAARHLQRLSEKIKSAKDKVVAIGEFGLDYDRLHFCPKEVQLKNFERQFKLAEETHLPLFLHDRNTGNDFLDIMKANRHRYVDGVVHSFTGSWEEAQELLKLGLYIGINGCSLKTEENLKVVSKIPLERMMLETDGPWCSIKPAHASAKYVKTQFPSSKKERFQPGTTVKDRCEPCHIVQVLEVVAALHNQDPDKVADICYQNTMRVFFPSQVFDA